MMRLRWAVLIALVVLAASAIAGVAQPRLGHSAATPGKTITVSGRGTVTTVPDRAAFDFTVETRAQTAAGAIAKAGDAAAKVAQAVRNAGVAAADVQTSQVSLSPQTNQDGTLIVGYAASVSISTKTTIAKAGSLVDAAVGAGATGVNGPSLSRSDQDSLYKDALKKAVADSKDKAAALASAAGLTLGGVQTIVEGSGQQPPIAFAGAVAKDASVPIEAGTQTIEADITVTYAAS
ncbi:MAG: uncharacterized protein QOF43_436 [Gaiellaceae bacterium]|jgi:uncharacterized protein YggE|nr:uncharacterized protein [Gaiellaceae bacterium]